jgi:hypothetical protein
VVNHVTRLGSNGAQDSGFAVGKGFNDTVQSLIRCADGTIVAGGLFTSYNGVTANRIVRLLAAPGAPYPTLRFGIAGTSLTMHWPVAFGSYQLQVSPTLTGSFTNFNTTLSTNGTDFSATVSPAGGAHFFRLRK